MIFIHVLKRRDYSFRIFFFQQFCKRKKYPVWGGNIPGLLLCCLFLHFKTYKVDLEFKQKELISSHGICVLTAAVHVPPQASWHCSSQLGKTADCYYPLAAEWQLLALLGSPVRRNFLASSSLISSWCVTQPCGICSNRIAWTSGGKSKALVIDCNV